MCQMNTKTNTSTFSINTKKPSVQIVQPDHRERDEPVKGRRGGDFGAVGAGQADQYLSHHQHGHSDQEGGPGQVGDLSICPQAECYLFNLDKKRSFVF